jgi:hypothetical protein
LGAWGFDFVATDDAVCGLTEALAGAAGFLFSTFAGSAAHATAETTNETTAIQKVRIAISC